MIKIKTNRWSDNLANKTLKIVRHLSTNPIVLVGLFYEHNIVLFFKKWGEKTRLVMEQLDWMLLPLIVLLTLNRYNWFYLHDLLMIIDFNVQFSGFFKIVDTQREWSTVSLNAQVNIFNLFNKSYMLVTFLFSVKKQPYEMYASKLWSYYRSVANNS